MPGAPLSSPIQRVAPPPAIGPGNFYKVSAMDAQEKWLEENAIRCQRFELRISPATCQRYQAEWPLRCEGCETAGAVTAKPRLSPSSVMRGEIHAAAQQKLQAGVSVPMSRQTHREKAQKGARRKKESMKIKEDGKIKHVFVLSFAGENREVMDRMAAICEADGTDLADDVATIIELFLDGQLKLRQ
jgi:hypothetical protein